MLPRPGYPLEYKPLPPTPRVSEPTSDNFTKFQINLRLPSKIDLLTVKMKWSLEMETTQLE
jgi:hypothetical protein